MTVSLRTICLILPSAVLVSCADHAAVREFDNPAIRELQSVETDKHITDEDLKSKVKSFLGQRTRIVFSGDVRDHAVGFPPAGRAAAVTKDGYFITAYHVVEDRPFYLQDTKLRGEPPNGGFKTSESSKYFLEVRHPGRLVWSSPSADFAIIKFPVENQLQFGEFDVAPPQGSVVFSADDEGYGTFAANEDGQFRLEDRIGNGDFFAGGTIMGRGTGAVNSDGTTLSTTLVARRGMSGAPLMTSDYKLCGVLSRVETTLFSKPKTVATMIEPSLISRLISADRAKQGTSLRSLKLATSG